MGLRSTKAAFNWIGLLAAISVAPIMVCIYTNMHEHECSLLDRKRINLDSTYYKKSYIIV